MTTRAHFIHIFTDLAQNLLKFLGVANLWWEGPPKSQLLAGVTPNFYKEGHSAQPVGGSSKKLAHYCRFSSELHSNNPQCHNQKKQKKVLFLSVLAVVSIKQLGYCKYQDEMYFCHLILQSSRRTDIIHKFFKFSLCKGQGCFCGLFGAKLENIPFLGN